MLFTRFGVLDPLSLIRELDNICQYVDPDSLEVSVGHLLVTRLKYDSYVHLKSLLRFSYHTFQQKSMLDYFTYISVCSIRSNYKIDLCTQIESIIFISNLINPSGLLTSSKTGFQTSRLWSVVSACHDLTRLSKTALKTSQSVVEILPAKERHVSVKATFCRPRLCSIECTPRSSALTKGVVRDRTAE